MSEQLEAYSGFALTYVSGFDLYKAGSFESAARKTAGSMSFHETRNFMPVTSPNALNYQRDPMFFLRKPAGEQFVRIGFVLLFLFALAGQLRAEPPNPQDVEFFEKRIRPVLVEHCYACHSGQAREIKAGFRLDSRQAFRQGGETGPAIVPGKPEESLLLEALRHESFEMPPENKLPKNIIDDFERWIARGAVDPRDKPDAMQTEADPFAVGKQHWSFQPVRDVAPLEVQQI